MKPWRTLFILFIGLCMTSAGYSVPKDGSGKIRILVVSSYHREYRLSQESNEGLCAAMFKFGYFDNREQAAEYTKNDYVETSKAIVKKLWMDSKRKSSKLAKKNASIKIYKIALDFNPDLIFLGDDNAAEYIGKKFLDSKVPIIFWGVNNTPVKYGLVDRQDRPGHNVTGVYQSGYYVESLELLKSIAPDVKTFAILSDNTPSGRSHLKKIKYFAHQGSLPVRLVETVSTNDYEQWKSKALEIQKSVDAFFLAQYSGLKDEAGNYVPTEKLAEWYTTHIKIPEAAGFEFFIEEGMLCGADDSHYNQGYEAVVIAHDILANGADPAVYPPYAPKRGGLMVNKKRAEMLGIKLTEDMGIEEYLE